MSRSLGKYISQEECTLESHLTTLHYPSKGNLNTIYSVHGSTTVVPASMYI